MNSKVKVSTIQTQVRHMKRFSDYNVIPKDRAAEALTELHNASTAGHLGVNNTLENFS